jgi:HK97 family phage portal protein
LWQWLLGTGGEGAGAEVARELTPPYPNVGAMIAAYIAARELGGPLALPAVERGVELIASSVAQLHPVAYRDGIALEDQPRIVERPDPWSTRYAFLHATVRSMVEEGAAAWVLFDPDPESRKARAARVVPLSEVTVELDEHRFLPVYRWRGKVMTHGVDFYYIPLAPRAGDPRGVSPLVASRGALLAIEAAELFAAGYFGGSGVPSGVLTSPVELTDGEADTLKAKWLEAHSSIAPTPAVLSGGITYDKIGVDPEASQLVETREHGVATVARLLGIPAPLLLVSTAGSSITYANTSQLYGELVRVTVQPLYIAPLEAALSDLLPRTSTVRFELGELNRLDVRGRLEAYQLAVGLGILEPEAIARMEGFSANRAPTAFSPTPAPAEVPTPEVPA